MSQVARNIHNAPTKADIAGRPAQVVNDNGWNQQYVLPPDEWHDTMSNVVTTAKTRRMRAYAYIFPNFIIEKNDVWGYRKTTFPDTGTVEVRVAGQDKVYTLVLKRGEPASAVLECCGKIQIRARATCLPVTFKTEPVK